MLRNKPVISQETEKKVRELSRFLSFSDTPLKSDGTHQIELSWNTGIKKEYIYIARFVGVSKNELQIVISPEVDSMISEAITKIPNIESATKNSCSGKIIQSSQYSGFNNKLSTGEHRGCAWRLPVSESLSELKSFLQIAYLAHKK